jgi:hypothetical protein
MEHEEDLEQKKEKRGEEKITKNESAKLKFKE